jgi:hypothetical protein
VVVGDTNVTGDVEFESNDDVARIETTVTDNLDGSMNLRFDALSSRGIMSTKNTGIRSITILRKTSSRLNVISRDGNPYLFLSRNGRMTGGNLVSRSKICSSVKGSTESKEYSERAGKDDCGRSGKTTKEDYDYTQDECSIPKLSGESVWDYLERLDRMTLVNSTGGKFYGAVSIPRINGFGEEDSVATMFIEGTITARFVAVGYSTLAILTVEHTTAASALFLGEYTEDAGGTVIPKHVDTRYIYLKPESMVDFFNYYHGSAPGSLGYQDAESVEDLCKERGWVYDGRSVVQQNKSQGDYEHENAEKIIALGMDRPTLIYTVRARDYFEHFKCKNWEVSSSDYLGDEVRYLVGWGTGAAFMSGGNDYSTFENKDGEKVVLPKWLAARYVWWKKYSKNGAQIRHFIVPKERGLVIYTGDYYKNADPINKKEISMFSWICDNNSWNFILGSPNTLGICSRWESLLDVMRARLTLTYGEEYDPTYGDDVFYGVDEQTFETKEVRGISVDDMDAEVRKYSNRVTAVSLAAQPYEAPVTGGVGSKGPFEYLYGRTYTTGVGYPSEKTDEEIDSEAIKAPEVYTFDINRASSNSFNIDTTDITASGLVYENPIHIEASDNVSVPESLDIKDPTDTFEVAKEMKKITTSRTCGNGIIISIAGLEG